MKDIFLLLAICGFIIICYKNRDKFSNQPNSSNKNIKLNQYNKNRLNLGNIIKKIESNEVINYKYNYSYNPVSVDELTNMIMKKAREDINLMNKIKSKLVNIYGEIKENGELRNYLLFNNLINLENMPIFIDESAEVLLFNEIKILVLTLD